MSDRPHPNPAVLSAEIIPFPVQPQPATIESPHDRLQRALASLAEAQAAQRAALSRWRGAISDLQTSMAGLGVSVARYQQSLERISTNLPS